MCLLSVLRVVLPVYVFVCGVCSVCVRSCVCMYVREGSCEDTLLTLL